MQVMEAEPRNNSVDTVQLTAGDQAVTSSQVTSAVDDGHCADYDSANKHLNTALLLASPRDVNFSLIVIKPVEVLTSDAKADRDALDDRDQIETTGVKSSVEMSVSEVNATEKDVLDDCCHSDGSEIKTVNVNTEPTNKMSVKASHDELLDGDQKLTGSCEACMKLEVACVPESEKVVANENCLTTTNYVRTSPNTSQITSESVCQDDCTRSLPKDLPPVVDMQTPRSLVSTDLTKTENECVIVDNCSTKCSVNDDHSTANVGSPGEMSTTAPQLHSSATSESQAGQHLETETSGSGFPNSQCATVEVPSIKAECCQTDVCLDEAAVPAVDAQNSPVESSPSKSIGCSPIQLIGSPANISHTVWSKDAACSPTTWPQCKELLMTCVQTSPHVVETVDCSMQTSPHTVDGSCSPIHNVMTASVGCSPVLVETQSARTSPIPFLQTGRSLVIDGGCSPRIRSCCEDSRVANGQTSPHCSTEHTTASLSTDKHQTAIGTCPSDCPQNNSLPPCGVDVVCQKLSNVVSTAESKSSYATPTVIASSSDKDPQLVAIADGCKNSEDSSTQPHSCEELFDDNPQLSREELSSVAHQPCSTSHSQLSDRLSSSRTTRNIGNDVKEAHTEDHFFQKLLDLDSSYSLESSQILPKCSNNKNNEDMTSEESDGDAATVDLQLNDQ